MDTIACGFYAPESAGPHGRSFGARYGYGCLAPQKGLHAIQHYFMMRLWPHTDYRAFGTLWPRDHTACQDR